MTRPDTKARAALAAGDRVAIVAGSGRLPVDVAERLVAEGRTPLVLAIEGEADAAAFPEGATVRPVPLERLGTTPPLLRQAGITHLVLAGGVARRPAIHRLRLGLDVLTLLPRLAAAYARGDDGLLRAIIALIERRGLTVVGAHDLVPDLTAPEGLMSRKRPTRADWRDMAAAAEAARTLGALDIGQGAVAIGGRAIALEDIDGTDGLLARVRDLRDHGRLAGRRRGVLVKCAKPDQELRSDLPAIGPATVDGAKAAGLAGIAVEAGRAFVLDFARTVERADRAGLFLYGLPERGRDGHG